MGSRYIEFKELAKVTTRQNLGILQVFPDETLRGRSLAARDSWKPLGRTQALTGGSGPTLEPQEWPIRVC